MATPLTPDQTADALLRRLRRTPELPCPDADAAAGPHLRVRWSGAVEIRCGAHSPHQAGFGPSAGAGDHRPEELSRWKAGWWMRPSGHPPPDSIGEDPVGLGMFDQFVGRGIAEVP